VSDNTLKGLISLKLSKLLNAAQQELQVLYKWNGPEFESIVFQKQKYSLSLHNGGSFPEGKATAREVDKSHPTCADSHIRLHGVVLN
jgi:hypothetical protein